MQASADKPWRRPSTPDIRMTRPPFQLRQRLRSLRYALAGLRTLMRTQHNAWLHAGASVAVVAAGLYFGLTRAEWSWLVLAITAVWMAEAFNTALEFLADAAAPEFHPLIGQAKDVAAAAVLITALGALVIGVLVLGPHVLQRLS